MPFHIVSVHVLRFLRSLSNRRLILRNNGFEIERAREVAQMFVGVHDFRSFMNVSHEQKTVCDGAQIESFEFQN